MRLSISGAGEPTPNGREFVVAQRLYKTKEGRVVLDGDPDANSLFKQAGARMQIREAIACGLITEEAEEESVKDEDKPVQAKQAPKAKNKLAPKARNKGKGSK